MLFWRWPAESWFVISHSSFGRFLPKFEPFCIALTWLVNYRGRPLSDVHSPRRSKKKYRQYLKISLTATMLRQLSVMRLRDGLLRHMSISWWRIQVNLGRHRSLCDCGLKPLHTPIVRGVSGSHKSQGLLGHLALQWFYTVPDMRHYWVLTNKMAKKCLATCRSQILSGASQSPQLLSPNALLGDPRQFNTLWSRCGTFCIKKCSTDKRYSQLRRPRSCMRIFPYTFVIWHQCTWPKQPIFRATGSSIKDT